MVFQIFVETDLPNIRNALEYRMLQNMRNGGRDVRVHVINQRKADVMSPATLLAF